MMFTANQHNHTLNYTTSRVISLCKLLHSPKPTPDMLCTVLWAQLHSLANQNLHELVTSIAISHYLQMPSYKSRIKQFSRLGKHAHKPSLGGLPHPKKESPPPPPQLEVWLWACLPTLLILLGGIIISCLNNPAIQFLTDPIQARTSKIDY